MEIGHKKWEEFIHYSSICKYKVSLKKTKKTLQGEKGLTDWPSEALFVFADYCPHT